MTYADVLLAPVNAAARLACWVRGHDDVTYPDHMVPADVRPHVARTLFCMRCWRIECEPRRGAGAYR